MAAVPPAGDGRARSTATRRLGHRRRVRPERHRHAVDGGVTVSRAAGSGGAAPSTASGSSAASGATTTRSACAASRPPTSTFHDTWYTSGLRGTGSLDFSVDDADRAARAHDPAGRRPPVVDIPLAAVPELLPARRGRRRRRPRHRPARDRRAGRAGRRASGRSSRRGRSPRARSRRSSWPGPRPRCARHGRSCTTRSVGRGTRAVAGERVGVDGGSASASPRVNAADAAAEVADTAYTLAGGSSVYCSNVLQRCLRDVHVATQHIRSRPSCTRRSAACSSARTPTPPRCDRPSVRGSGRVRAAGEAAATLGSVSRGARASRVRRPLGESSGGTTRPISVMPAAAYAAMRPADLRLRADEGDGLEQPVGQAGGELPRVRAGCGRTPRGRRSRRRRTSPRSPAAPR